MLACFDASGHECDRPFLVVAGFVSSAGDWDEFAQKWIRRLNEDGLPYFHANEFAWSKGVFDGWKEERKRPLAADLMDIISGHAYRYFIQAIKPIDFNAAFTQQERERFHINAYALCGRTCVAELGRWLRGDSLRWDNARVPDLVFEDGDIGKGKLRDMLVRHNYPEPQFLPGKLPRETELGKVEPFVPLQAADWLAYESFRLLKRDNADRNEWRWPMREFYNRMQGVPLIWTPPDLDTVKDDLAALDKGKLPGVVIAQPLSDSRMF